VGLDRYEPEGFALKIFKDRYAIHPDETFAQACERVARAIADAEMGVKRDEYFNRFMNILGTNRFSPGGRIWRGAGRPRGQMLNCLSGETLVQTKYYGAIPIKLLGGTTADVLSIDGVFRSATWFNAGEQYLYRITLENGDILFATLEHEWPVYKNGKTIKKVKTKELLNKRILIEPSLRFDYDDEEYVCGVRHGLVFGDGSLYMNGKYSRLQQFGDSRHLVDDFFNDARDWPSTGGRITSKHPPEWKKLPTTTKSRSYLRGFVAGLIGSDGHVDKRGHCMIHNKNRNVLCDTRNICKLAGIATTAVTLVRTENPFNGSAASLYKLTICKGSIIGNSGFDNKLIIKNKHRENIVSKSIKDNVKKSSIKVVGVEKTNRYETVFCCEEQQTHTFVIDNFYLTGNCFVIPADDSREGWGDVLRNVTIISGTGGGVGINFSKIRPRGTPIRGTGGEATGSVSLMRAVNAVCNELREGGGRRSALLYCLDWRHPDLLEFLRAKLDNNELANANISILVNDEFFDLLSNNGEIIFKWKGEERGRIAAQEVWNIIIKNAWENGDPGILNIGLMRQKNSLAYVPGGEISSTNPCGEQALEDMGSCCLGAINLSTHVIDNKIDWDLLEETIAMGVRFLDNVIDQNHYPLPIIEETSQKHRRIGLGVMGLHDMLLKIGLKYSTSDARDIVDKVMDFVKKQAYYASISLAIEKGPFQAIDFEKHIKTGFIKRHLTQRHRRLIKEHGIRNCALLTIAPTGTTSIVSGCSSGIEPLFHPVYRRQFNEHKDMHDESRRCKESEIIIHPLLKTFLLADKSIGHFQGAHDINPKDHIAMQVICQKHIDNSISKTINIPHDYPITQLSDDILACIRDLKGITIYRDGSKGESPLMSVPLEEARQHLDQVTDGASVNDCPSGACDT